MCSPRNDINLLSSKDEPSKRKIKDIRLEIVLTSEWMRYGRYSPHLVHVLDEDTPGIELKTFFKSFALNRSITAMAAQQ